MSDEEKYIGLMSGTSVDSIDAALVTITDNKVKVLAYYEYPITKKLQTKVEELCLPGFNEIDRLGELSRELGILFADATLSLLASENIKTTSVKAIGSHGQTVRHRPGYPHAFTLQIGDPSTIAFQTGITTVADFRAKDIAGGGQGAPLTPAFHNAQFSHKSTPRIVLNIGGIANISRLSYKLDSTLLGFDTGPGNTLMDYWTKRHLQKHFDHQGEWAKSGVLNMTLLDLMLSHPYFQKEAPKSTGREEFSSQWLEGVLALTSFIKPQDIQRTLCEFTALTICKAIDQCATTGSEIILCGGGSKNTFLVERLKALLPKYRFDSTQSHGIAVEAVEASAFAWLAYRTLNQLPGNCASVTGTQRDLILGGIYFAD